MVKQLTHKRIQAINELALDGETSIIAHWREKYGIPLDGTDEEIQSAVLSSTRDVTIGSAMEAARRLRRSQDARKILLTRYPATACSTPDVSFSDLEDGSPTKLSPSKVRKGLYFYRGHHVKSTGEYTRAGTIRYRPWQIGTLVNGVFIPESNYRFQGRAAALNEIDDRLDH